MMSKGKHPIPPNVYSLLVQNIIIWDQYSHSSPSPSSVPKLVDRLPCLHLLYAIFSINLTATAQSYVFHRAQLLRNICKNASVMSALSIKHILARGVTSLLLAKYLAWASSLKICRCNLAFYSRFYLDILHHPNAGNCSLGTSRACYQEQNLVGFIWVGLFKMFQLVPRNLYIKHVK